MASLHCDDLGRVLQAEYDYRYKTNDGRMITIETGEEFILIKKANEDWWQVIKLDQKKPFYVPATYIKECPRFVYPEHAYFKKAFNTLQKSKKKQRLSGKSHSVGSEPHSDSMLHGKERKHTDHGSKEDLTRLSNEMKSSPLRASCDSLDRFIENENPYDEVPLESKVARPSKGRKSVENSDDAGYANLEAIQTLIGTSQASKPPLYPKESESPSTKSKTHHQQNVQVAEATDHLRGKPIYANFGQDNIQPRLPSDQSNHSVTTVEILEDGWELQLDDQTNSKYYLNSRTGEMRVKPPRKSAQSPKTAPHMQKKNSLSKVVPPAVPDASKKPTLESSNTSPRLGEDLLGHLERRSTSPARVLSRSSSQSNNENRQPFSETEDDQSNPDISCESALKNKNNNNIENLSPEIEKKKRKDRNKKTNSKSLPEDLYRSTDTSSDLTSHSSSPLQSINDSNLKAPPAGWYKEYGQEGDTVFVRESTGDRWHEMLDNQSGENYYFNELTNETSWQLPQLDTHEEIQISEESYKSDGNADDDKLLLAKCTSHATPHRSSTLESYTASKTKEDVSSHSSSLPRNISPPLVSVKPRKLKGFPRQVDRVKQARSMILLSDVRSTTVEEPLQMIERQGRLHWTKLMEAGKKQKKNWMQQWVVLLANNLLFYKDQKQAAMSKTLPHGKPESSCYLRGANIEWAKDKSSKKNVIELQTVRGLSLLLQHDDNSTISKWLTAIKETIQHANQVDPVDADIFTQKLQLVDNEEDDVDSKKKKDKKKKQKPARHGSDAKNSDKVRSKLKKFINRRPTFESLQERGIIKETVFGCPLDHLCEKEQSTVPNFVRMCVEEVERRGLDVDGIYRVSGNLSHVQKLRYLIDRDEPVNLSDAQWEDIHLITGALKMFLRELPEPVFPFEFFDKFIYACKMHDERQRITAMKHLVQTLPPTNQDTLRYLMKHFCNVVEHSSKNRMQVQNIAIVFGPTLLLKPPDETRSDQNGSGQMAIFMVYQNQIIDTMLTEYDTIFGQ